MFKGFRDATSTTRNRLKGFMNAKSIHSKAIGPKLFPISRRTARTFVPPETYLRAIGVPERGFYSGSATRTKQRLGGTLSVSDSSHAWYAIRVKSRCEKMVSDQFRQKGYEEFLPMYWSRRLWSDRVKVLQLPVFSGYIFCRFDVDKRLAILQTPGVVHIVAKGKIPAPVDPQQLENVRLAITSGQAVQPWSRMEVGRQVRIELGPMRGVTGTLLRYKNASQMILGVDLMQRAVAVEVDESWVVPCHQPSPLAREAAMAHA